MRNKNRLLVYAHIFIALLFFSSILQQIVPVASNQNTLQQTNEKKLTIFHVNDVHGWIEPHDGYGGIAHLMSQMKGWGYDKSDDSSFLLSAGDDLTGPAVSSLSKGMAMVDLYNEMNFSAAAVGNHEFDFGIDAMNNRNDAANFPMLSANILEKGTNQTPSYATPWVIQEHNGVNVGIIGLTVTDNYLERFIDLLDYETAIRNNIDDVREAGANVVFVLAHVGAFNLKNLAKRVSDLNIALFLGGHHHASEVALEGNLYIVEAGEFSKKFSKTEIIVDTITDTFSFSQTPILIDNFENDSIPDKSIQSIVEKWTAKFNIQEVITKSSIEFFPVNDGGNLIPESFLHYFKVSSDDQYNFAFMVGAGGIRDTYRAGDITIGDIISVLPYEDILYEVTITGSRLNTLIQSGAYLVGGVNTIGGGNYELITGNNYTSIDANMNYTGLIPSFVHLLDFNDLPFINTEILYRDTMVCYYRTIDDLANFIDVKYNPTDHGTEACLETVYTLPISTSPSSSTQTTNPSTQTSEVASTTLSSETSSSDDSIFKVTTSLLVFMIISLSARRKYKKSI